MNINIKKDWQENIKILLAIVVLMWVIELISSLFGQPLNRFGIRPRSIAGLSGIIFAQFYMAVLAIWLLILFHFWF